MRRKSTLWTVVLLLGALQSPNLWAQTKVGVVDFQQALLDTAEMKKQAAALEGKYRPRQEEIEKLTAELQEIQKQLQTASGAEGAKLQNDGTRKQREVQRLNEDLQADVQYDRDAILGVGREKMQAVVSKLGEEKGLDLVIDVRSSYFFKPAMDLTREATAAYDVAHPVSQ
jgi:outer membrane protein